MASLTVSSLADRSARSAFSPDFVSGAVVPQDLDSPWETDAAHLGLKSDRLRAHGVRANYQCYHRKPNQHIGANAALQWRRRQSQFRWRGSAQRFQINGLYWSTSTTENKHIRGLAISAAPTTSARPAVRSLPRAAPSVTPRCQQAARSRQSGPAETALTGDATASRRATLVHRARSEDARAGLQHAANPPSSTPARSGQPLQLHGGGLTRNENHYVGHEWAGRLMANAVQRRLPVGTSTSASLFRPDRGAAGSVRYAADAGNNEPVQGCSPPIVRQFLYRPGSGCGFQRNFRTRSNGLTNGFNGVVRMVANRTRLIGNQTPADESRGYIMAKFLQRCGRRQYRRALGPRGQHQRLPATQACRHSEQRYHLCWTAPVVDPVIVDNAYNKWLPSANIRFI